MFQWTFYYRIGSRTPTVTPPSPYPTPRFDARPHPIPSPS